MSTNTMMANQMLMTAKLFKDTSEAFVETVIQAWERVENATGLDASSMKTALQKLNARVVEAQGWRYGAESDDISQ